MLGAGLRREFPGAYEWAERVRDRVPRPRVGQTGFAWAVLAGLGAKGLVGAALGLVVSTLLFAVDTSQWPGFRGFELRTGLIEVAGGAIGLAVAFRAGGWRAAVGLIAVLTATDLANAAAAAPGRALFCERNGGQFGPLFDPCAPRSPIDEITARWPRITGLALGLLLARRPGTRRSGSNASLETVGAIVAGQAIAFALSALFAPGPAGTPETMPLWTRLWTVVSVINVAIAVFGGHLLVRRGQKPWPAAAVLATLFFVPSWLPTLVYAAGDPAPDVPAVYAWLAIAPLAHALAFVLAAILSAAFARPRRPDAGAARRAAL